ncbi:MAG: hypothetical protein HYU97_03910 [Deltaproteobacteria bacterium]|nr:hypothetical protein [Deltaproteobacteria bacterium]
MTAPVLSTPHTQNPVALHSEPPATYAITVKTPPVRFLNRAEVEGSFRVRYSDTPHTLNALWRKDDGDLLGNLILGMVLPLSLQAIVRALNSFAKEVADVYPSMSPLAKAYLAETQLIALSEPHRQPGETWLSATPPTNTEKQIAELSIAYFQNMAMADKMPRELKKAIGALWSISLTPWSEGILAESIHLGEALRAATPTAEQEANPKVTSTILDWRAMLHEALAEYYRQDKDESSCLRGLYAALALRELQTNSPWIKTQWDKARSVFTEYNKLAQKILELVPSDLKFRDKAATIQEKARKFNAIELMLSHLKIPIDTILDISNPSRRLQIVEDADNLVFTDPFKDFLPWSLQVEALRWHAQAFEMWNKNDPTFYFLGKSFAYDHYLIRHALDRGDWLLAETSIEQYQQKKSRWGTDVYEYTLGRLYRSSETTFYEDIDAMKLRWKKDVKTRLSDFNTLTSYLEYLKWLGLFAGDLHVDVEELNSYLRTGYPQPQSPAIITALNDLLQEEKLDHASSSSAHNTRWVADKLASLEASHFYEARGGFKPKK